ncbi:MAG: HAD-IA family hydrolase [Eggerthellaceae bacterium]|nr:HAD-IA family hydrolase [Eggerthellaceae bacterium]
MTLRGILFDNDGTLVDTHDLILSSMRHTTRVVLGHQLPDEQLMAKVGIPLADQMMDFASSIEQRDELLRVYREHNHAHHDAAITAFPAVLDGVRQLADAGFKMGVVTSKKAPLATRGLQITGIWPYMDCLVGPDDCQKAKPEPDPILLGADMLGLEPAECMYVGDSPFDIHAGNAAGCTTVAALWGMFAADELEAEKPGYSFESFEDFADWALQL